MFTASVNSPCINEPFMSSTIERMHASMKRLLDSARNVTVVPSGERPIQTFAAIAARLNVSSATMTNWKARGISKAGAISAESLWGIPAAFLLEGKEAGDQVARGAITPARDKAPEVLGGDLAPADSQMPEADPDQPQYERAAREVAGSADAAMWPFRRILVEQWAALDDYDRVLVEAAAAAKLRDLLAERAEQSAAAGASNVQTLVSKVDAGQRGGLVRTPAQAERRRRELIVENDRRHGPRRAADTKD